MTAVDALAGYLQDHLGGATAGVRLARRLRGRLPGAAAAELDGLASDIADDRAVLRDLVDAVATTRHPLKQAAGTLAARVHQLAVHERVTGSRGLSLLLELETLALGIEGKRALWEALLPVAAAHPGLAAVDLAGLADRAAEQRRRVEAVRLAVVRRAFGGPDPPG